MVIDIQEVVVLVIKGELYDPGCISLTVLRFDIVLKRPLFEVVLYP